MVYEIGQRYTGQIARRYDLKQAEQELSKPGVIYEAELVFSDNIPEDKIGKAIWDAVASLRQQVPGINITYIRVDGNKILIQFYDDPGWVSIAVIIGLIVAALLATAYAAQVIGGEIREIIYAVPSSLGQLPGWTKPVAFIVGVGVGAALLGYGIAKIVKTLRSKPKPT